VPSSFKKYACPLSLVLVSEPTASVILKSDTYKTRHSDHQLGSSICVFNTRRQVQSALPWYLGATTVSTIDSNGAFLSPKDLHGRLSCVCDLEHSRVGVFLEKDGRAKGHSHPGSFVRTPTQIIYIQTCPGILKLSHNITHLSRIYLEYRGATDALVIKTTTLHYNYVLYSIGKSPPAIAPASFEDLLPRLIKYRG
jgi:hypothetical protein